jgi:hypothetical protein
MTFSCGHVHPQIFSQDGLICLDVVIGLLVRCSMYEIDAENFGTLFKIILLPVFILY